MKNSESRPMSLAALPAACAHELDQDTTRIPFVHGGGDRLIRRPELELVTGLKRSPLYRTMASDPSFPKPIKISERAVAWSLAEVYRWIEGRKRLARVGAQAGSSSTMSGPSPSASKGGAYDAS